MCEFGLNIMEDLKTLNGIEEEHGKNEALYLLPIFSTFSVSQEREM